MNRQLIDNNYVELNGFISADLAENLANQFYEYSMSNECIDDCQIPNARGHYNFMPFVSLLVEKTQELSTIVGEQLLPTYTYARVHTNSGVELQRHTDRHACEVSVTLNLSNTAEWPICIEKPDGSEVCLDQDQGDAMLYLGCKAPHWRPKYEGNYHIQVFLHYVRADGPNAWAYFDRIQ